MRSHNLGTTPWRAGVTFVLCLVALMGALGLMSPPLEAQSKSYAILVVGNERNEALTQLEVKTREILKGMRDRLELDEDRLPLLFYHFDKASERSYCEETLGIKAGHLLFVGLVEHKDGAVRKVLLPVNKVTDPVSASTMVMSAAARKLGKDPSALRAPETPAPPSIKLTLVNIGTYTRDGRPCTTFSPNDAGVFFKGTFHNEYSAAAHDHRLAVKIYGPDARLVGLQAIGGPFTVERGESLESVNLIKRADPDRADGYPIAGKYMARNPGTYTMALELDGIEVGRTRFEILPPAPTSTSGGIEVVSASVQDYGGASRTTFTVRDRGVFINATLRNTNPLNRHEHVLRVTCYSPNGRVYGTPLGGTFVVEVGQTLDNLRFPSRCDPNHNNGYLIAGKVMARNPGTYRFVLEIDGRLIRTFPFYVTR